MKASEIRELSPQEMQQKLNDFKEALFNLRFQHEVGQLENSKKLAAGLSAIVIRCRAAISG